MRGTFCITRSTVAQSLAATALCCCSLTPSNILATRMEQLSSAHLRYNHATPVRTTKHAEVLIEGVLTAMLLRQTQGRKSLHHNFVILVDTQCVQSSTCIRSYGSLPGEPRPSRPIQHSRAAVDQRH